MKQLSNVFLAFVHRRCNDMIGWFPCKLLNVFTEICFYTFNIMFFKKFIEMDLLGHHTLALHYSFALLLFADLLYMFQSFFCIFCPENFSASCNKIRFEC